MAPAPDFGDLKTESGLAKLNEHLATRSYISDINIGAADVAVLKQLCSSQPCREKFPHAARWYRHMHSYTCAELDRLSGGKGCAAAVCKGKEGGKKEELQKPAPPKEEKTEKEEKKEADDLDLFGSDDEEDDEALKKMAEEKKAAAEPKKKKEVINKSTLVIEIKPASSDTDLGQLEEAVRKIEMEGVTWSTQAKRIDIAFGLQKLQIGCVIIDSLVNTDGILERIECIGMTPEQAKEFVAKRDTGDFDEDDDGEALGWVQSADIVSFQKI